MDLPRPIALVSLAALLTSTVFADSVKLKSGEVYNGKVIRETETQIVMEVSVAAGITDEKTFSKDEVDNVSKTTADALAFEALKSYAVGAYSFQPNAYLALQKPLETFLKNHPESTHASEVQAMLDALKAEEELVVAGNLKWENRWYTPEEVQKNQYQLGAAMRFGQMKAQIARRDFIGALNSFAQIESAYPGSSIFPDAVETALALIPSAAAEADKLQAAGKMKEADFNKAIPYVNEPQKSQMLQAWKAQVSAAEATFNAAASKPDIKWKPLLTFAPKSFDAFKATVAAEKPRLAKLPLEDMRASLACTEEAETLIQDKKMALAAAKLKEAEKLWSANERIKALAAAQKAPAATSAPSTPSTTDSTSSTGDTPAATPSATPENAKKAKKWGLF